MSATNTHAGVLFTIDATTNNSDDPDPSAWEATVTSVSTFLTEAANIALADEVASTPANNAFGLGGTSGTLTFDKLNTGLPWSFTAFASGSTSPVDTTTGFTYNDIDPLSPAIFLTGTLSPGDIDNHDDDDVVFTITDGPDLFGFSFEIVHTLAFVSTETVQVFGAGDLLLGTLSIPQHSTNSPSPPTGGSDINLFIGITSDIPIKKIVFDEAATGDLGDDIAIRDFRFAAGAVPEPSTFGLAVLSLLSFALYRWRRVSDNARR